MIICVRRQNVESGLKLQTDEVTSAIDYIKTYMTEYLAGNELSADFYAYVNFSLPPPRVGKGSGFDLCFYTCMFVSRTRMWANAQRDGRPAEYRWRSLFNAAVWLTSITRVPCSDAAKTRNPLKLGCSKLPNRSQPLVGRSSPYYEDVWRRYCCLTFFPIVYTCLSCEDTARQICAMVPRWRFFCEFLRPVFSASRVQYSSDLHSKFALRPHHVWHCGSMVDIQSATAEIRRGKKEERKKQNKNIMSASATQGGHNNSKSYGWF